MQPDDTSVPRTSPARRWWALGVLCLSLLVIGFDVTILNVALATMAKDLNASTGQLQWIADAYVVVLAALLMPAGAIGDRYGRKRVLITGFVLFGVASALCAFASETGTLIAARAFMGIGAAIIVPLTLAMLPVLFAPEERGKALAVWSMGSGVGLPLGPILGGWLLEHYWWGSIFLINVPILAVVAIAAYVLLPESKSAEPRGLDFLGGLLSVAGLVVFVYGVIEGPEKGWGDPAIVGSLVAGVVLLAGFVVWERHTSAPMVDLRLLTQRKFLWPTVAVTLLSISMYGTLFLINPYLQIVLGYSTFGTGVRLLPIVITLVVGSALSDVIRRRLGARFTIAAGLCVQAAGLIGFATVSVSDGYGFLAAWLGLYGLGIGLSLAPAVDVMMETLPEDAVGGGTALNNAFRQVGGALGIAVIGTTLNFVYRDRVDDVAGRLPAPAAHAVRDSVVGAVAVAQQAGGATGKALVQVADKAYVHGMATGSLLGGIVVILAVVLVVALLGPEEKPVEEAGAEITRDPDPSRR